MTVRVIHGDMLEAIPALVEEGVIVDAVVTDPPYHLSSVVVAWDTMPLGRGRSNLTKKSVGFMGQQWDGGGIAFNPATWATAATILRPGGFLLAFGGTRTAHRMVCAIEDAGFVIQDTIAWLYGSGFPKNRTLLKPAHEPIVVAYKPGGKRTLQVDECRISTAVDDKITPRGSTGLDNKHEGWARPLMKDRATMRKRHNDAIERTTNLGRWPANVCHDNSDEVMAAFAAFGNTNGGGDIHQRSSPKTSGIYGAFRGEDDRWSGYGDTGSAARFFKSCPISEDDRWSCGPANFAEACSNLQSEAAGSVLRSAAERSTLGAALSFANYRAQDTSVTESELESACDSVTATIQSFAERFWRGLLPQNITVSSGLAKCVAVPEPTGITTITLSLWTSNGFADRATFGITQPNMALGDRGSKSRLWYSSKADAKDRWGSRHPTVKPVELMKWLVALVTPPQGTVLDPFAGSGTTAVAAMATDRNAIVIEREDQYVADIRERMAFYEGNGRHSMVSKNRNRQAGDRTTLSADQRCQNCHKIKSRNDDQYGCRCETPQWQPDRLPNLPLFPEIELDAAE